jgi:outer membrane lipoprotein-sorting protein
MRIMTCGLLFLCLVAVPARADDQAEAQALIARALKAAGGEEKLARLTAQTVEEKGTWYGMGQGLPYTGKYSFQWPDRFRMEVEGIFTMVVNGDKGWIKNQQGTVDMPREQLGREKENIYGSNVATLVPLKDKAFTLTTLPETKIEDRPCVGVKVTHKDRRDVLLYFDKQTGLLIKTEQMVQPEDPNAAQVKQEAFQSEFKDFDGVKVATKVVVKRDGKVYVEAAILDVKLAEKLDDTVFGKP